MMKDSLITEAIDTLLRICKRLTGIWFCVLMLFPVAGVSSVEKYAYIGQAAELVSNISSHYEDPALYRENGTYITSWKGNTAEPSDRHYVGKFHMDDKRNIWILRVEREDAGNYSVRFGAKNKRHVVNITLTVKEEQPQECRNNHPDFTKEDGWNPLSLGLQIVTFIIVTITLLMKLANRNQIRKGLINMKDWIQKKLCSRHMPENEPQNQENESLIEVSVVPDSQVSAQHDTNPASSTVTGETTSKRQKRSEKTVPLSPRNDVTDSNGKLHQTVLNRCLQNLMKNLRVSDVMEHIQQKGIFDDVTIRDINDQTTASKKILHILYQIKQRDQDTYEMFKECLFQSNHKHLKKMLEEEEEKIAAEMKVKHQDPRAPERKRKA